MRFHRRPLHNVFSDKSSLVLRALLTEPGRKWRLPELSGWGVSIGQVVNVVELLAQRQWVQRGRAWRDAYVQLTRPRELLAEWTRTYHFDWNWTAWYRVENREVFPRMVDQLMKRDIRFALTLFSASDLVAPHVVDAGEHLYVDMEPAEAEGLLQDWEGRFVLPYPGEGGNIGISLPYYRTSVFQTLQRVEGLPLVSNLQLYLDLIHHPISGREQAEWLEARLTEAGTPLAGPQPAVAHRRAA